MINTQLAYTMTKIGWRRLALGYIIVWLLDELVEASMEVSVTDFVTEELSKGYPWQQYESIIVLKRQLMVLELGMDCMFHDSCHKERKDLDDLITQILF